MMMTYRGYTLVPLMDGGRSQVSVFSRANLITKTVVFADEQSAVAEARKFVDAILSQRQLRSLAVNNFATLTHSGVDSGRL
jgi:hypothetical protein